MEIQQSKIGFTLLEVIIALGLIIFGVGAALNLLWQNLGFSDIASSRLVASYLCQEGIETVRNIRDSNWLKQRRVDPNFAWDSGLEEGVWQDDYVSIDGVLSKFKRKITIAKPQTYILEVVAQVSWQERGRTHRVRAEEHLYNSLGMD